MERVAGKVLHSTRLGVGEEALKSSVNVRSPAGITFYGDGKISYRKGADNDEMNNIDYILKKFRPQLWNKSRAEADFTVYLKEFGNKITVEIAQEDYSNGLYRDLEVRLKPPTEFDKGVTPAVTQDFIRDYDGMDIFVKKYSLNYENGYAKPIKDEQIIFYFLRRN